MQQYRLSTADLFDYTLAHPQNTQVDACGTVESCLSFQHKGYNLSYSEISTPNFRISVGKGFCPDNLRLDFAMDTESVEMHFSLSGQYQTFVQGAPKTILTCGGDHNLFYAKNPRGHMLWAKGESKVFEVNMSIEMFEKYFPKEDFETFRGAIQNSIPATYGEKNYPITTAMYRLIADITECKFQEEMRVLYLESKILELLLLQIEQIQSVRSAEPKEKDMKEKMCEVERLIKQNISHPHTLSTLCLHACTNECTLKREFKQQYGTTVFNYIRELRMEKAKQLLEFDGLPIATVSEQVGYKNPQHFSTAFKNRYGVKPSDLKRIGGC